MNILLGCDTCERHPRCSDWLQTKQAATGSQSRDKAPAVAPMSLRPGWRRSGFVLSFNQPIGNQHYSGCRLHLYLHIRNVDQLQPIKTLQLIHILNKLMRWKKALSSLEFFFSLAATLHPPPLLVCRRIPWCAGTLLPPPCDSHQPALSPTKLRKYLLRASVSPTQFLSDHLWR